MVQTHVYTDATLPADLECQTVSFIRIQWPFVFDGDNRFGRRIRTREDADIGILFCQPSLVPFYEQRGWDCIEGVPTLVGTPEAPTRHERQRMMLFMSPKGQAGRDAFATVPIYIGRQAW